MKSANLQTKQSVEQATQEHVQVRMTPTKVPHTRAKRTPPLGKKAPISPSLSIIQYHPKGTSQAGVDHIEKLKNPAQKGLLLEVLQFLC